MKSQWLAIVLEWSKLYNIPLHSEYEDDLTKIDALKFCAACGANYNLNRHHKAHDFYFACLRPDLYAHNYMEFKTEDVDILCGKCHKAFHKALDPRVKSANIFFRRHEKSKENCDKWRDTFLQFYIAWLDKRREQNLRQLHKPRIRRRKKKRKGNS